MSEVLQGEMREKEQVQYMDFSDYRRICDSVDRFRKVGIQDSASYEAALIDSNTVFVDIHSKHVPLYVDVAYEKMYETDRCHELFNSDLVLLQCLPVGLNIDHVELPSGTGIIWEEFETRDSDNQSGATQLYITNKTVPVSFTHPHINDPEHSHAWMASYSLDFSPSDPVGSQPEKSLSLHDSLRVAWEDRRSALGLDVSPQGDANGTFMLFNSDIAANPHITDDLWKISESGFGKVLGAHHPVSMEFNRSFFDQMISADSSVTAAHYVDGKPVCFGFIGLDMQNNDWLNVDSTDLNELLKHSKLEERDIVHFYELISDGERGMGLSMNILDAFLDIAARSGRRFSVFFESTNLSSLYIPDIIRKKVGGLPSIQLDRDIEMIDRLHYHGVNVE